MTKAQALRMAHAGGDASAAMLPVSLDAGGRGIDAPPRPPVVVPCLVAVTWLPLSLLAGRGLWSGASDREEGASNVMQHREMLLTVALAVYGAAGLFCAASAIVMARWPRNASVDQRDVALGFRAPEVWARSGSVRNARAVCMCMCAVCVLCVCCVCRVCVGFSSASRGYPPASAATNLPAPAPPPSSCERRVAPWWLSSATKPCLVPWDRSC